MAEQVVPEELKRIHEDKMPEVPAAQQAEVGKLPLSIRSTLTEEELKKLSELQEKVSQENLTQKEKAYCTEAYLRRCLIARDWSVKHAFSLLTETLKWRRNFKPDDIEAEKVGNEAKTGKLFRRGKDKHGRPVVYMTPGRENTKDYGDQIKLLVYTLERAIDDMQGDVEQMVWIIDFGTGAFGGAVPPISVSIETIQILSSHYPERLGVCFLVDTPWFFSLLWKAVYPFINARTYSKIRFVSGKEKAKVFPELFNMDEMEKRFSGTSDYDYNHDVYWPEEVKRDQLRLSRLREEEQQNELP